MSMMEAAGTDGAPIQMDERWLMEWFEYGWSGPAGLIEYATKYAEFEAFCAHRERSERSKRGWETRRANQQKR